MEKRNRTLFSKILGFIIIVIVGTLLLCSIIVTHYKKYCLYKYGKYTVGYITKIKYSRNVWLTFYKYNINNIEYSYMKSCKNRFEINDKILIKYSSKKNSISKIMCGYTIPDDLTVMPKNGWEEIPSFIKKE